MVNMNSSNRLMVNMNSSNRLMVNMNRYMMSNIEGEPSFLEMAYEYFDEAG